MSDIIDYIRKQLTTAPALLAQVEPVLRNARQVYGGDTVYVRTREPAPPTRRTLQRRARPN